jgi:hypothetical protein
MEWGEIRPRLFSEINFALLSKSDSSILEFLHTILVTKGCNDFEIVLPGILANARGPGANMVDAILVLIMQQCEMPDIFAALQAFVGGSDLEVARAALGVEGRGGSSAQLKRLNCSQLCHH